MTTMLDEFYNDLKQEVYGRADANENFIESSFVEYASELIVDSGEIDSFDYCHYKSARGIRVDGYDYNDDEGILSLFVLDFRNSNEVTSLTKTDIDASFKRVENFFIQSLKDGFYTQLEETSPGYGLAYQINSQRNNIKKINLFLLSDGALSTRVQSFENKDLDGYKAVYHIWDLSRLHRLITSGREKEDIKIDMVELFGEGLPCLPAHIDTTAYKAYLVVIPGRMLAALYDRYGARLLEQNVRCFLQARGKVNKGIRNTIINDPEMFFAYNNGITATAEDLTIKNIDSIPCITNILNFQIVNGGQTSASIYNSLKKDKADLDRIFVQMKLSIVDHERSNEVVPKISEYANSQNKVNAADFFANHPFHIRMEEFSRRLWAPAKEGEIRESKWFYERARGQYLDAQAHLSKAEKKKFLSDFPKAQMFNKTDLAKFENPWQLMPQIVSRGAQKNFVQFAKDIGSAWEKDDKQFNELYFKHIAAKTIIFRTTEKIVTNQPWYDGGYRANIVVYTIALIAHKVNQLKKSVNFTKFWEKQQISDTFYDQIVQLSKDVNDFIVNTPSGIKNVTEWCKKDGCWLKARDLDIDLIDAFIKELVSVDELKSEKKDAKKTQKIDDVIEAQTKVIEIGAEKWTEILTWGTQNKLLSKDDTSFINIATRIPTKIPSEKQSARLINILNRLQEEGFVLE